eukprot:4422181-Pyramimonas_sp.AAC.1
MSTSPISTVELIYSYQIHVASIIQTEVANKIALFIAGPNVLLLITPTEVAILSRLTNNYFI